MTFFGAQRDGKEKFIDEVTVELFVTYRRREEGVVLIRHRFTMAPKKAFYRPNFPAASDDCLLRCHRETMTYEHNTFFTSTRRDKEFHSYLVNELLLAPRWAPKNVTLIHPLVESCAG